MEKQTGARVEEYTRQYRYPRKRNEVDAQACVAQRKARKDNNDSRVERKKENCGCAERILATEYI